jgi:aryl-alcohol dehydrogenase-like predicted oxidoreductase
LTLSVQQNTEAWKTLETFVTDGKIKHLGISNIYQPSLLRKMIDFATVPVDIVQNRWWEGNGWDWESEFHRTTLCVLSEYQLDSCSFGYLQGAWNPISVGRRQWHHPPNQLKTPIDAGASGHYQAIQLF